MNDFIAIDRRDSIDATVVIISGKRMKCISVKSMQAGACATMDEQVRLRVNWRALRLVRRALRPSSQVTPLAKHRFEFGCAEGFKL
jgi:hypothetical protein